MLDVCLFSRPFVRPQIFIMDADGNNPRQIKPDGLMAAFDPDWSPDGSWIVFAGIDDQDDGIFIMNRDGTNVQRVSDGDGDSSEPAWSPDGQQIVFVRQHPGGVHLYIINTDGTGLRQITDLPGRVGAPAWSPDGTRIAFFSDFEGNDEIYLLQPDGTGLQRLTNRPAVDAGPVWSPDGERITFTSGAYGSMAAVDERELGTFTMNADGSNLHRIEILNADDNNPRWSPDGQEIAFVHEEEIMVSDSDGNHRRNLTQHPLFDYWPRWSPDGSSILFLSMRNSLLVVAPGRGFPEPVLLRADGHQQEGGAGSFCEPTENGFQGRVVLGVWLPRGPITVATGSDITLDFTALTAPSALEIIFYDYELAERLGKIANNVIIPPCAPPGGTEEECVKLRAAGPVGELEATYNLDLPPGHYAVIVRANFEGSSRYGYTEQGFNLIIE